MLEQVESDLNAVDQLYQESEEFQQVLDSPVIGKKDKLRVIRDAFQERLHPLSLHFLEMLVEKSREGLFPAIHHRFLEMLDEAKGILRGELITAFPFTEKQLAALKKKLDSLTGMDVILTQKVEKELIGGFVIRLKDTVIDSSLKNQLLKMREKLVAGE